MMPIDYSSPADRLVAACLWGSLPSAQAAVADGARVNVPGKAPGWSRILPLRAAVDRTRYDVVVWLLSLGADPDGERVMYGAVCMASPQVLQLLIDVGGSVNRKSNGDVPLFFTIDDYKRDMARVLLDQPRLDMSVRFGGKVVEDFVRGYPRPALADLIADEVRRLRGVAGVLHNEQCGLPLLGNARCVLCLLSAGDATRRYGACNVAARLVVGVAVVHGRIILRRACVSSMTRQSPQALVQEAEVADLASVARLVRRCHCTH